VKTETQQKIDELLGKAALRKTRQRVNILKVLLKAKSPLSQDQITRKLRTTAPNKVTVYRCLEKFTKVKLVHNAYLQDRTRYYELSNRCTENQCHPHFTCTSCGITTCMEKARIPMAKGIDKGYIVHRQQVRLEGLCPNCAK